MTMQEDLEFAEKMYKLYLHTGRASEKQLEEMRSSIERLRRMVKRRKS